MDVLAIRALVFGVHNEAPVFLGLPILSDGCKEARPEF